MAYENGAVVALGTFDGVHCGHHELIATAVAQGEEWGLPSVAYTFSNHPRGVFGYAPEMLQTANERRVALMQLGLTDVVMDRFDTMLAALRPRTFIERLCTRFHPKGIVVGFNYTFGAKGAGNGLLLKNLGREYGFATTILAPVHYKNATVSSTRIRDCILNGHLRDANAMLGYPYMLCGPVVENRHIGSTIGFPTANIAPPEKKILPKFGVYATAVSINGKWHTGVTNVGDNPTVGGEKITVETHLLDYAGNLYGRTICVRFLAMLRDEKCFENVDALKAQIARDVGAARVAYDEEMRNFQIKCGGAFTI